MQDNSKKIKYISEANPVNMSDAWYEIASLKHFWIRRRFSTFCALVKEIDFSGFKVAEVGCGNGIMQKQIENHFGLFVDGFELNENALENSIAKNHPRIIYDINERNEELNESYDFIILFDVIEHIEDEFKFIESTLTHLKRGGILAVNVPAYNFLYSTYDKAAGHLRRYTIKELTDIAEVHDLKIINKTYWGFPLIPLALARKILFCRSKNEEKIIRQGFKPPGKIVNYLFYCWSKLEFLPQCVAGTSAMMIYKK